MKTKSFKIVVAVLAILLVAALTFGITGAFYTDRRAANGTLKFDNGISINYSGLRTSYNGVAVSDANAAVWQNGTTLYLFQMSADNGDSIIPNKTEYFSNVKLSKGTVEGSGDVWVKVKLVYRFYQVPVVVNGNTKTLNFAAQQEVAVPSNQTSQICSAVNGINTSEWTLSNGWYYYTHGTANNTALTNLTSVFTTNSESLSENRSSAGIRMATFDYAGEGTGENPNRANYGGYPITISNIDYVINKVTVELVVDAIQAGAVAANSLTW